MKLQLSICAKDLPSSSSTSTTFYAVVYNETSSSTLGKTQPTAPSTDTGAAGNKNVTWNDVVSIEDSEKKVNVVIYDCKNGDSIVTSALFDVPEILASQQHQAQAKRTPEAAVTICVHVQPEQVAQLHLVLGAKDLPDTDFGFNIGKMDGTGRGRAVKQMTDPFFEIYDASNNRKLVRSNVCEDTLNPTWQPVTLDLNQAFGTLDTKAAKMKITIYDKDQGDAKEYLGQVERSVEQLLVQQSSSVGDASSTGIPLVFNRGSLLIVQAKLLPQQAVSRMAMKSMNAVCSALQMDLGAMEQALEQATKMAATAKMKQNEAVMAHEQAVVLEKKEQLAAEHQGQAQNVVSQLGAKTKKLAEQRAKNGPCTGKLLLQLRAENLPDLDMGLLNKSDPVFHVYSAADATQQVHRSNIVSDNLNPTWDVSTMDLVKLCQGNLDAPFRIAVYDKNGGDDTDFLGHVNNVTVNQLLQASPNSQKGMALEKAKRGMLFVVKAELDQFVDLVQQLDELKEEFTKAQSALDESKAIWKACNEKAEQARHMAVVAQEVAEKAQDDAEEAQLSVDMAKASLK